MTQSNFHIHEAHIDPCHIDISAHSNKFISVGSDDVLVQYSGDTNSLNRYELINESKMQINTIAIHPFEQKSFIFGTKCGLVFYLNETHNFDLKKANLIYKSEGSIRKVQFSESGRFIFIAADESKGIVYDSKNKRFKKLPKGHNGLTTNIFVSQDQKVCCTIATDGVVYIFSMVFEKEEQMVQQSEEDSEDPFSEKYTKNQIQIELIGQYKIAQQNVIRKHQFINGAFTYYQKPIQEQENDQNKEQNSKIGLKFFVGGQITLQQILIDVQNSKCQQKYHYPICEGQEILQVCCIKNDLRSNNCAIATSTLHWLSIWRYSQKEKLFSLDLDAFVFYKTITKMISFQKNTKPEFLFIMGGQSSNGNIYEFINYSLLRKQEPMIIEFSQQKNNTKNRSKKLQIEYQQDQSIASKVLNRFPQNLLQKGYEQYMNCRFLFYNSFGCVIQRNDDSNKSSLELEFHDQSRISRIKIKYENRSYCFFALQNNTFVYASHTHIIFQNQKQLKEGFQWQFKWQGIQGITIGSGWVAAINKEQIKIFDFAGFQIHSIAFDRKFVSIEAFQDMLAVVYHSSLPMSKKQKFSSLETVCNQSFQMKLYKINLYQCELERQTDVPIQPNMFLNWFGFSEDGIIYCQDTAQVVSGYSFENDQWSPVYSLQNTKFLLYISHIEKSDIFGFKIQQKGEQIEEPKVNPRSLPRKIPMDLPFYNISFLLPDQNAYLKKIMINNMIIRNEEYRNNRWFKHKYSRLKKNQYWNQSQSVLSQSEIEAIKMKIDNQLVNYVNKFIKSLKNDQKQRENFDKKAICNELMFICERLSHFGATKTKIRQIINHQMLISIPILFSQHFFMIKPRENTGKQRLDQLDILERIMNPTWAECSV